MSAAQYARLVSRKYRGAKLPRTNRKFRPRVIAWAGPTAFYNNRFYEKDSWYKARIDKPRLIPELHLVDPSQYSKSISQILAEGNEDPINIGFAVREQKKIAKASVDPELEKLSRKRELRINIEQAGEADWRLLRHAGIFEGLFRHNVFFHRTQNLEVSFGDNAVHTGNVLWAEDTKNAPAVTIESVGEGGYNTLIAVNLDGNAFEGEDGEIVHWVVTNIPDGKGVEAGEEKASWMQTLPFFGTGYHRLVFLLFRHSDKLSLDSLGSELPSRIVNISKLYKQNEDIITPSAALFSNVLYDLSVKECLHSQGLQSPLYEYEWNERRKREQKEFPLKPMPFDLYLDQFRDPKEVQAEIVRERLQRFGIKESQPPLVLDDNYVENKKQLDAWRHAKLLQKNRRDSPLYNNALKS